MPKFKNHPILERRLKSSARYVADSFRSIQASRLGESQILMPSFIGIGAPRAASTWLHDRLTAHPQVFVPHRKELHFFDAEASNDVYKFASLSDRDRQLYATFFQRGVGLVRGEITPAYSCLPRDRVAQIAKFLPKIKVIYILRNPVDRAWSGIRRRCWYGEGKKANQVSPDELMRIARSKSLLIRGDYRRNITVWESEVPSDRIHYMFYDDIADDGVREIQKLCDFIGISSSEVATQEDTDKVVNNAPVSTIPRDVKDYLRSYYLSDKAFLEAKFGRDLSAWYDVS